MKFPTDPAIAEQKKLAEADKIEAIQERSSSDTGLIERLYSGSAIRKAAFGNRVV